jgi:hypothetical protein
MGEDGGRRYAQNLNPNLDLTVATAAAAEKRERRNRVQMETRVTARRFLCRGEKMGSPFHL